MNKNRHNLKATVLPDKKTLDSKPTFCWRRDDENLETLHVS